MADLSLLLILVVVFLVSAGFTIGLTYAPCYASMCTEQFFPSATREHIAGYYGMVASIGLVLLLRAHVPWVRAVSATYVTRREVPLLKKRISLGGLTLAIWIIGLTVASTAYWVPAESGFWSIRTVPLHWPEAEVRLAVTGIVGHHCDIILGLLIIPVSRNSILGRVFSLHQSTLLYAHKLLAYTLLIVVIAHGGAYYTFVGAYAATPDNSARKNAFNVDNPTLTLAQSEAKPTYWSYMTLPSGMLAFLAIAVITITALPVLRRRSYNTFYYVHIIASCLVFFFASIHASTDFYFLLPGLLLWIADWAWRLFRGDAKGTTKKVNGVLEDAGHGWYRLTLPPAARLSENSTASSDEVEKGRELNHPLQTFYINVPGVSKLENHAFTAAEVGTATIGPVILFQRSSPWSPKRKQEKQDKEWTWKVGAAASAESMPTVSDKATDLRESRREIEVRVEGPYVPREVDAFRTADKIICIVGGTGLTGAYSLAMWWLNARSREPNATFTLIWTVRHRDTAMLREWQELEARASAEGGKMSLIVHVSSEDGRLDIGGTLRQRLDSKPAEVSTPESETQPASIQSASSAWVYVSGPDGLLRQADDACVTLQHELRAARKQRKIDGNHLPVDTLDHYVAKWEV